jgi:hypothetical protein
MPGLPRKSTEKQFRKLMKKSGKSKTNKKYGGSDPSSSKIATYEQFCLLKELKHIDIDPYGEENWEGELPKYIPPQDVPFGQLFGQPGYRIPEKLPFNSLEELKGLTVVGIRETDSGDGGVTIEFENGRLLDVGYSSMEGTTFLDGVEVETVR